LLAVGDKLCCRKHSFYRQNANNTRGFQQFLTISQILAGVFPAANSSSKFGGYPAKQNFLPIFLRRNFGGKYNFGGYGKF